VHTGIEVGHVKLFEVRGRDVRKGS
jgi:hypothetical protein